MYYHIINLRCLKDFFLVCKCYSVSIFVAGLFGLHQHGVHLNGYTIKENNEMFMWIGQRSLTKATYPGMWDNMV